LNEILHKRANASFWRRLLAATYDWLLVIALMMVISTPLVAALDDAIKPGNTAYQFAMLVVAVAFFVGFWSRGGQTLGMKAWRLKLCQQDGSPVNSRQALLRFIYAAIALAPAGLGFFWMLWDPSGLTWHDRWSGTVIELLPKK